MKKKKLWTKPKNPIHPHHTLNSLSNLPSTVPSIKESHSSQLPPKHFPTPSATFSSLPSSTQHFNSILILQSPDPQKTKKKKKTPMSDHSIPTFNSLSIDLIEFILSHLPIPSLIRASCVCKLWNSIIASPGFSSPPTPLSLSSSSSSSPWFFLYGLHNTSSRNNQSFAYDPLSNSWFKLPIHHDNSFFASSGFLFTTYSSFSYTPIFNHSWRVIPPLHFPRINPLLAVYPEPAGLGFIVVGGVRFIGNLVDIEDRLAVEIYNPRMDSWDLCPPLPADFRS